METVQNDTVAAPLIEQMSCELTVAIPIAHFGVADLVEMVPGAVIDSRWEATKEVPLDVNRRHVAWCEFEVVGQRLGVRITELK